MPSAGTKKSEREAPLYIKVNRLKDLLHASGETRAVDEREITSKQVIKNFRSVEELHALFARKPRSVLWLCEHAYLYKRSSLRSALDLLGINVSFRGLRFEIQTEAQTYAIEVHWDETQRSNRTMIASIDRFLRLLARDGAVSEINVSYMGATPIPFLPVSPTALRHFVRKAASPRTVFLVRIRISCFQAPMLFTNTEGSVVLKHLDVSLLQDGGTSLLRAVSRNTAGIRHLYLKNQMSVPFFDSLMKRLSTNRSVNTLSIFSCDLTDSFVTKLTEVLRVNTIIRNFKCEYCTFSIDGWSMLWRTIKENATLTTMSICGSRIGTLFAPSWILRDNPILDAFQRNTSLVDLETHSWDHKRQFLSRIEPFLRRNRIRKLAQDISTEPCQDKRWRFLGHALNLPTIQNDRATVYSLLRSNVDNWASHAPTGKEIVQHQLSALDKQRAILLAKLREYENPQRPGDRSSRKRKRDEDDVIVGGGSRRMPLRDLQDGGELGGRPMRRRGAPRR